MKKKMMKLAAVSMVLAVFFAMAAGSTVKNKDSQKPVTDSSQTTTGTTQAADAQQTATGESEAASEPADKEVTIAEQVLIDQDGVKITATGLSDDTIWGKGVKLLIENNTDKDLGVGCSALIVNNYMITDLFSGNVAAGKKSNETMHLSSSALEAAGIENIGEIEIYLYLFDSSSYKRITEYDKVTIQTSEYANMDTKAMDDGKELINQNGIRIVGKYVDESSFWGSGILLYVENTTDQNVGISCDDLSINGFMMTPFFSSTVYAGKMSVDEISLLSTDLESNGITSIDDVELKFKIYEAETYKAIFETEAVSFTTK